MVSEAKRNEPKRLTDMPYFPATVAGHSRRETGTTLHTIGDDWKTDVVLYDDPTLDAHRAGVDPNEEN